MIDDLKELEKFFKICRKQGVTEITLNGTIVKFGEVPTKTSQVEESEEIPTDELTAEQLMFYAVPGPPV